MCSGVDSTKSKSICLIYIIYIYGLRTSFPSLKLWHDDAAYLELGALASVYGVLRTKKKKKTFIRKIITQSDGV
jgi:hypothetical protein